MALITRTIPQLSTAAEPDAEDLFVIGRADGPARGISYAALRTALAGEGIGGEAADVAVAARVLAQEAAEAATEDAAAAEAARVLAEAALAAALTMTGVVAPIVQSLAAIVETAPGEGGQEIEAGVNVLEITWRAPNFAIPATVRGRPFRIVRMSLADIEAADCYPDRAVFRTADRVMPDLSTDAVNGGYWVIAEPVIEAEMFGQLHLNHTETTATLRAFHEMSYWAHRRGELTGDAYTINGPLLAAADRANGGLNITRRGPVTISVAGGSDTFHSVIYARTSNPSDLILDGAPMVINGNALCRYAVFGGHDSETKGGHLRVRWVVGQNLVAPIDQGAAAVAITGRFSTYDFAHNGALNVDRAPSAGGNDGECKGLAISNAVGDVAMVECWAANIHAKNDRDADGLSIFGALSGGAPLGLQASFIGCRITNAQVRSIKTQFAETFCDARTRFVRTNDMVASPNSHEVGAQWGGLHMEEGWRAEYGTACLSSNHVLFIAQPLYADRAAKTVRIGKGQVVSGQAMAGLVYVIMGANSRHVIVDIEGVDFVPTPDLTTSMFTRGLFEADMSQVAAATSGSLHVRIYGTRGPNTVGLFSYTGYSFGTHGSLAARLSWDLDENVNTLTAGGNTPLVTNLSGGVLLDVPRGRMGSRNTGYSNFQTGAQVVGLGNNVQPAGHEMALYLPSSPVISNGPAGLSGGDFARIQTWGNGPGSYLYRKITVDDGARNFVSYSGAWNETTERPMLTASETYDPASLAAAGFTTIKTITVPGAAMGDRARATFSNNLAGVNLKAWVSAANTVSYQFVNDGGANPTDLASGTVYVFVEK